LGFAAGLGLAMGCKGMTRSRGVSTGRCEP
jgi:hypothetical protein